MNNPLDLSGRTVLVTGASSGLGRETAVLLSELGARVIASGRSASKLSETAARLRGDGHRMEALDLEETSAIGPWVRRLASEVGPIYGLVHSAGVSWPQPLRTWDVSGHERLMRINLTAALALAKAVRAPGVRADVGAMVFLSSISGVVGTPAIVDYSASKGAIISMTRSLALELAKDAIRVNCVAPGLIQDVGMSTEAHYLTDAQKDTYHGRSPLGPGRGLDVANAIAFLLSPAARWITGVCLSVDGGVSAG